MTRPTLLSYRTLGLGDLLTAVPALRALRRAYPGHRHVLATPAWLAPLIPPIGAVDEHLAVGELAPVPRRPAPVDVAVNLHGSGPQSHTVVAAVRPTRLIAFHHPAVPATADAPRWRDDEHEVVRWCRLLTEHGISADGRDLHLTAPPAGASAGEHHLAGVAGATVLHPGAKSRSRRWPPGRFAAVARSERAAGRTVVVTGSPGERELATAVAREAGLDVHDAVLAGRTDVGGLARVVAAAGRVVCGDTGVAHLATALGTPSVVLFGPTPPRTWGPPVHLRDHHRVLWAGREGDPLADRVDPGLAAITVADVVAALAALPDRPSVGTARD